MKLRMYVRLRSRINQIPEEISLIDFIGVSLNDTEGDEDGYDSDVDGEEELNTMGLAWYQFDNSSITIQAWDSFMAIMVLFNIIVTPVALSFPKEFH